MKTSALQSSLCAYSHGYILLKGTILVAAFGAGGGYSDNKAKNCTPFTDCISKINKTEIDNTKVIDVVMLINIYFDTVYW